MITEINELKTLTKHISYECKCIFYGRTCNSNQKWNNDKCRCKCKNKNKKTLRVQKKNNKIWNPATCSCENGKYLARIIDDSVITYDEIIKEIKTVTTIFNEKSAICKQKNSIFYLLFY